MRGSDACTPWTSRPKRFQAPRSAWPSSWAGARTCACAQRSSLPSKAGLARLISTSAQTTTPSRACFPRISSGRQKPRSATSAATSRWPCGMAATSSARRPMGRKLCAYWMTRTSSARSCCGSVATGRDRAPALATATRLPSRRRSRLAITTMARAAWSISSMPSSSPTLPRSTTSSPPACRGRRRACWPTTRPCRHSAASTPSTISGFPTARIAGRSSGRAGCSAHSPSARICGTHACPAAGSMMPRSTRTSRLTQTKQSAPERRNQATDTPARRHTPIRATPTRRHAPRRPAPPMGPATGATITAVTAAVTKSMAHTAAVITTHIGGMRGRRAGRTATRTPSRRPSGGGGTSQRSRVSGTDRPIWL
eukprot:m.254364 g.254364  ORF g.254364 m.254364 type:complete len:368 (+) comp18905_c0_seq1:262-1365(+)